MQALRGYLTTSTRDDEPSASVLAEWKKYESGGDVESGGAGQASSSTGSTPAKSAFMVGLAGARFMQETLSGGFSRAAAGVSESAATVSSSVSRVGEKVSSNLPSMPEGFTVPTPQQFTYFAAFMGAGLIFLVLAFTIALPVIVLSPSKFAFSFTIGCALIMSAFAALKGWKAQVSHMMEKDRLPFSLCYISSMVGTLYAAMVIHSYLLSIVFSGAQVVALLYYMMSYFPGGTAGVRIVMGVFSRAVMSCFSAGTRAVVG